MRCLKRWAYLLSFNVGILITSYQERVVYNKEVQTAAMDEESGPSIEELRQQLRQEYEEAQQLQKDKELEEEAAKLDKEIEEEIRGKFIS